jgi:GH24 family phage-related lysozyme (muramidase)
MAKPVDVTGASGQRPSRSARTQAERITGPNITQGIKDFKRETFVERDVGISGAGAFAEAFAGFFDNESKRAGEREELRLEEENRNEAMRIEALVNSDRAGAREAYRTGETESFITPGLERRKAVANTWQKVVAQTAAMDDAESWKKEIASLPDGADPDAFVQQRIKENIEGGSPMFMKNYAEIALKNTNKSIQNLRKNRAQVAQAKAIDKADALLKAEIETRAMPESPLALRAQLAKITNLLPAGGKNARVLTAEAIRDKAYIRAAGEGNQHALRVLRMKDKDVRNGTSIADRNPGEFEKARQAYMTKYQQTESLKVQDQLISIEDRLSQCKAGHCGEGDSLTDIFADMRITGSVAGVQDKKWQSLRDKVVAAYAGKGTMDGALHRVARNLDANLSNADHAKLAPALMDPAVQQAVADKLKAPVGVVRSRFRAHYARRGPGKGAREGKSSILMTGPNSAQVTKAFDEAKEVWAIRKTAMDDRDNGHYTQAAWPLVLGMLRADEAGQDPMQFRQQYQDALKAADGRLNLRKHYEQREDANGKVFGGGAARDRANKVWKELGSGNLKGQSPAIQEAVLNSINLASAMLSTQPDSSDDAIEKYATAYMQNRFVSRPVAGGGEAWEFRKDPTVSVGPDGVMRSAEGWSPKFVERMDKSLDVGKNAEFVGLFGNDVGFRPDDHFKTGHGAQVTTSVNGVERDLIMTAGKEKVVGLVDGQIPPGFPTDILAIGMMSADGQSISYSTPRAPRAGEPNQRAISENMFILYDDDIGGWRVRIRDMGPNSVTPASLEAQRQESLKNKEQRENAADSREVGSIARALGGRHQIPEDEPVPSVGEQVPEEDHEPAITPHEAKAFDDLMSQLKQDMVTKGYVSPLSGADASKEETDNKSWNEKLEDMWTAAKSNGEPMGNPKTPYEESYAGRAATFIGGEEGYRSHQYNDMFSDGRIWKEGDKGNPTVGYGLNLNAPFAKDILATVGLDYDKVRAGNQAVSEPKAAEMRDRIIAMSTKAVRTAYRDLNLEDHQVMALTSLHYNGGPKLAMGTKLKAALQRGDLEEVAFQIAWNSENVAPEVRDGIHDRRIKEAIMFLGPQNAEGVDFLQPDFTREQAKLVKFRDR